MKEKHVWIFILAALLISLLLAGLVSPFASSAPDGLERVAENKGFQAKGEGARAWRFAPIPDYVVRGIGDERTATAIAGVLGTLLVFGAALGLAKVVTFRSRKGTTATTERSTRPRPQLNEKRKVSGVGEEN